LEVAVALGAIRLKYSAAIETEVLGISAGLIHLRAVGGEAATS